MRKNILIFGHSYATQFIDINNQYTKLFDHDKFHVTVIYLVGEENQQVRSQHCADEVIFLNSPKNSVRGLKLAAIKKILQLCHKKQFAIVICHRYKPTYVMLWVALFYKFTALFFIMHELGTLSSYSRRALIATLNKKNMIFAGVSDAVRNDLRKDIWRVNADRTITLYNMIDIDYTEANLLDRESARKQLNLSPEDFVFGNIGRLAINKDQKTLLQAFANIKQSAPKAKLIILGEGQLEQDLKQQVNLLRLNKDIIFTGFVPEGFRFIKAFDIFVLSSIQEAFGRVLLEAMIAKVPIIATAVNGIPEVIGQTGTLVEAGNTKQLAEAMLNSYQTLASVLSERGLQCYERAVKNFSLAKFNEIFWQLPLLNSSTETL